MEGLDRLKAANRHQQSMLQSNERLLYSEDRRGTLHYHEEIQTSVRHGLIQ